MVINVSLSTQTRAHSAHPQFASRKDLLDGVFSIEDTFKLPKLEGEDLRHGDIALIYHSVMMYAKYGMSMYLVRSNLQALQHRL